MARAQSEEDTVATTRKTHAAPNFRSGPVRPVRDWPRPLPEDALRREVVPATPRAPQVLEPIRRIASIPPTGEA